MTYRLLSDAESNAKLAKTIGNVADVVLASLSLRPANLSGYEVCPWRGYCTGACVLEHSGRGNMANVQEARDRKTKLFFENRSLFIELLHNDLHALERKANRIGALPFVRLNVASDLPYESIDPTIFSDHPSIRFYDYTKGIARLTGARIPDNYALTYSYNERSNPADVVRALLNGHNVAVVFDTIYKPSTGDIRSLPTTFTVPTTDHTCAVVDGDTNDIRIPELDGRGVVVGLRGKGGKRIVTDGVRNGFIQISVGGLTSALA